MSTVTILLVLCVAMLVVVGTVAAVALGWVLTRQLRYGAAGKAVLTRIAPRIGGRLHQKAGDWWLEGVHRGLAYRADYGVDEALGYRLAVAVEGMAAPADFVLNAGERAPLGGVGALVTGLTVVELGDPSLTVMCSRPTLAGSILTRPHAAAALGALMVGAPARLSWTGSQATCARFARRPDDVDLLAILEALAGLSQAFFPHGGRGT